MNVGIQDKDDSNGDANDSDDVMNELDELDMD